MRLLAAMVVSLSLASACAPANQVRAVSGSAAPSAASSQDSQTIKITRSGSQPSSKGPAEYFTGSVRVDPLFTANDPSRTSGARVTFEPGARTAWHTHPLGQTLIVTAGSGWVQQWGGQIQEILPGDVVRIPPGQKHWHGATATTGMTHIAIQEHLDGKTVDWMEMVSDVQYGAPVWARPDLSPRDRSLVTVSALIAMNRPDQLRSHLARARDNGVTQVELIETITHLAFYAGWPSAVTAISVAKEVFQKN